ncbi:hypothetical protein HBH64_167140 [Parastagonospora nodorum]|nr:hypothetical protein HBI09_157390 [Parastagonospora nodorum]KAH4185644.1 hypothetical protein HBH42_174550 [Parastagonospora nodorum]KAH4217617.1 hypothetical protein HBI06_212120 [Parastagonospora nodorum]KAH4229912.1 hypothetical protein HBI05_192520 [Parastagonospora nodorum]KAH4256472.1 hypothetical protein HBI03_162960 [Parastagonospora nodorum]
MHSPGRIASPRSVALEGPVHLYSRIRWEAEGTTVFIPQRSSHCNTPPHLALNTSIMNFTIHVVWPSTEVV